MPCQASLAVPVAGGLRHLREGIGRPGCGRCDARATAIAIVRALPGGSIDHILIAAYLYPPANVVSAHRPAGLRRAFVSAGVRTTVLTSEISGSYDDDREQRIIRAGHTPHPFSHAVPDSHRLSGRHARRPRQAASADDYIVPVPTALSWFPQALTTS